MAKHAIRTRLATIRGHLSSVGDGQPLHRAALAIVVLLDVFILVSIVNGLDAHTAQLVTPWELVPPVCGEIVVERAWTPSARLDRLTDAVHAWAASPARHEATRDARHPVCAPILAGIEAIRDAPDLVRLLELRRERDLELRNASAALAAAKAAYDTSLLERMARQDAPAPAIAAIRDHVHERTAAANAAQAELSAAEAALDRAPRVAALWAAIQAVGEQERLRLVGDLRSATFWFPVKRLGMELLFLGPLLAVLYAWNAASVRARRGVQALVSTHLLVIAALPVLAVVVEAVYDVLPKVLLKRLVDLLVALRLVAIWHYLVIAAAVVCALFLVWVVQKKMFSRERVLERRIAKGLCQGCGKPLPAGARACVFCGFAQLGPCARCGGDAHVLARHCRECGAPLAPAGVGGAAIS